MRDTNKQKKAFKAELGHTVVAGYVDRGKPTSSFEVMTISPQGDIIRTYHATKTKADRAAQGRSSHHRVISVIEQSEDLIKARALEILKAQKQAKKLAEQTEQSENLKITEVFESIKEEAA